MYKLIVKYRSAVLVFLTHKMALPFLKLVRRPELFPYEMKQLSSFPQETLGKELHDFLIKKNLELLPYYAKHDIKHILLRYDTTDEGEVCLQCFMLGNRHLSFAVAATVLYGFVTMPEYWKCFIQAYRRGKVSTRINDWKWFSLLEIDTDLLSKQID